MLNWKIFVASYLGFIAILTLLFWLFRPVAQPAPAVNVPAPTVYIVEKPITYRTEHARPEPIPTIEPIPANPYLPNNTDELTVGEVVGLE